MKMSITRLVVGFSVLVLGACHAYTPRHVVSRLAYDETVRALTAHAENVARLPGLRNGSAPIFLLHPVGSRVHGTVVIFHGFGLNAFFSRIQAQALFYKKFNVVAFNIAGFAQAEQFWKSTVLRESAGYSALRKIIREDPFLAKLLSELENDTFTADGNRLIMPRLFATLKTKLSPSRYAIAKRAIRLLAPGYVAHGVERDLRTYFRSGHQVIESDPFEKLNLVQALPGPVHAMGYSFGCVNALNMVAASKVISRSVLLAPYVGRILNPVKSDAFHFGTLLGVLNLSDLTVGTREVPGRFLANLFVSSNMIDRDVVTNSVRESTKTLCILAEDDSLIDVPSSLEMCRSKIAATTFVYPKELKLDHALIPELGRSNYTLTMLEQVANFLISGNVKASRFLIPNSANPNPGLARALRNI